MSPSNPLKKHHHLRKKTNPQVCRCFSVSFVGGIFRWTCRLSSFFVVGVIATSLHNSQPNHHGCWEFQWVFYRKSLSCLNQNFPAVCNSASEFVPCLGWWSHVTPNSVWLVKSRDKPNVLGDEVWSPIESPGEYFFFKFLVWWLVPPTHFETCHARLSSSWDHGNPQGMSTNMWKHHLGFCSEPKDLSKKTYLTLDVFAFSLRFCKRWIIKLRSRWKKRNLDDFDSLLKDACFFNVFFERLYFFSELYKNKLSKNQHTTSIHFSERPKNPKSLEPCPNVYLGKRTPLHLK